MAGAVVGYLVSSVVAEAVAAEVVIAGLALDSVFLIEGASMIGAGAGLIAGGITSNLVNGALVGSPESPQPSSVTAARAQGLMINAASNVEPIPVVYGARRLGGAFVLEEVSGPNNEYFHLVVSFCEGEIDGFDQIYLDDVPITDARFAGLYTLETYVGSDTQAASAALIAALPGVWSATDTGSGVAYVYLRLTYDQNAFHGRPVVTADVRGKKLYDPRTGLTVWSDCPPLATRDYLTNARYGRGISASAIIDAAIITAANHSDEMAAIPGGMQKRYTIDGAVDINATLLDNIKMMLTCCRGMLVRSGGKYKLLIDKAETPSTTFAFTEDNITGDWSFGKPGRRDTFNRVTANFFNRDAQWQPDFAPWDSTAYRVQDNGLPSEDKINLPYTANMYRAMQLAGLHGKQSRFGLAARFSAFQEGLCCEIGDVVPITHSTPGWVNKPVRVMQIEIKDDDEVDIVVREYDASVYPLDTLTAITGGPATNLPDPFTVSAPASLTLTSGTAELLLQSDGTVVSRLKAAWPAPADAFVVGSEIQLKLYSDTVWRTVATPRRDEFSAWLSPVLDGGIYDVRIRFVNALDKHSPWTTTSPHTVIGETEIPSTVATCATTQERCFFPKVPDRDVPGYQIRAVPGTQALWSLGVAVHDGLVTDSPYSYQRRLTGVQTIMVAAVDRGGRVGVPAWATLDFGVIDPLNIAQSYDFAVAGFPGTITNGSVVGGHLVADADPAVDYWSIGAEDWWTHDAAPDWWGGSAYLAMQYATLFTPLYSGGEIIIDSTLAGSRSTIEWRTDGATVGDFWAPDRADFWAGADYWGVMPAWQPYIGVITSVAAQGIQIRVSTDAGPIQGDISALAIRLQMPSKQQVFSGIAIAAGGTRLAPASGMPAVEWIRVEEVNFTVYADGSGATSGRVVDFDPALGPMAQTLNAAGTAVSSTGQSARVSGY